MIHSVRVIQRDDLLADACARRFDAAARELQEMVSGLGLEFQEVAVCFSETFSPAPEPISWNTVDWPVRVFD